MSFKMISETYHQLHRSETVRLASWIFVALAAIVAVFGGDPQGVIAGTNQAFTTLEADASGAIFGPLGQTVIYVASLGGALMAAVKGAWLFAGLGIAVAGLMFGAQAVATSGAFGGLI
jgi:hypothetical protein